MSGMNLLSRGLHNYQAKALHSSAGSGSTVFDLLIIYALLNTTRPSIVSHYNCYGLHRLANSALRSTPST